VEQAGVDDTLDARLLGGLNDVAVLRLALPDLARRDQEQRVDPGQCRSKRLGLRVIERACLDARSLAFSGERTSATIGSPVDLRFRLSMTRRPSWPVAPVTAMVMTILLR
jgi:hypothetical protein